MAVNSCLFCLGPIKAAQLLIITQHHLSAYTLARWQAYNLWESEERVKSCAKDGFSEDGSGRQAVGAGQNPHCSGP